jgi:hypothetical protein
MAAKHHPPRPMSRAAGWVNGATNVIPGRERRERTRNLSRRGNGAVLHGARFRIGAESALTRVFDALWRRPE